MVERALIELKHVENDKLMNGEQAIDEFQVETQSDVQVTVTPTTLDTSTPTDDTTIQDAMISPDSESALSKNASLENMHRVQNDVKIDPIKGSCSNSIISFDSTVSDTLDSKSLNVKNSESEIGKNINVRNLILLTIIFKIFLSKFFPLFAFLSFSLYIFFNTFFFFLFSFLFFG